jgi:hypothetical protein
VLLAAGVEYTTVVSTNICVLINEVLKVKSVRVFVVLDISGVVVRNTPERTTSERDEGVVGLQRHGRGQRWPIQISPGCVHAANDLGQGVGGFAGALDVGSRAGLGGRVGGWRLDERRVGRDLVEVHAWVCRKGGGPCRGALLVYDIDAVLRDVWCGEFCLSCTMLEELGVG